MSVGGISMRNPKDGYNECWEISNFIKSDAPTILSDLKDAIESLKNNWKGENAITNQEKLIIVHKGLGAICEDATTVTKRAGEGVHDVAAFDAASIGETIEEHAFPGSFTYDTVSNPDDYTGVYVEDIASIQNFYDNLCKIRDEFSKFSTEFNSKYENLFDNWMAGGDRDTAFSVYSEFATNSDSYKKILEDVVSQYAILNQNTINVSDR